MMAGGGPTVLGLLGLNADNVRRKFYWSRSTGLNPDDGRRTVYWAES
jgi:hypothetical protein